MKASLSDISKPIQEESAPTAIPRGLGKSGSLPLIPKIPLDKIKPSRKEKKRE